MSLLAEELKNEITKASSSGSLVTIYHYNRIPSLDSFPHVSFYISSDTYNGNDVKDKYSDLEVQFNVFSNFKDYGTQCNAILDEITEYYDNGTDNLNVSGSTMVKVTRDFIFPAKLDEDIWQGVVQYTCHLLND